VLLKLLYIVSKDLGEEQRNLVVSELEKANGMMGAEFCLMRNHLVLAKYDRNMVSSQDVLKSFNSLNLDAKLIGPI
jgi:hypothetical protein